MCTSHNNRVDSHLTCEQISTFAQQTFSTSSRILSSPNAFVPGWPSKWQSCSYKTSMDRVSSSPRRYVSWALSLCSLSDVCGSFYRANMTISDEWNTNTKKKRNASFVCVMWTPHNSTTWSHHAITSFTVVALTNGWTKRCNAQHAEDHSRSLELLYNWFLLYILSLVAH